MTLFDAYVITACLAVLLWLSRFAALAFFTDHWLGRAFLRLEGLRIELR